MREVSKMKLEIPNKTLYLFFILVVILGSLSPTMGSSLTEEEYTNQARAKVKEFAKELKNEFQKVYSEKGPLEAISVCTAKASEIANKISRQTGWMVRRVSLKTRNPLDRPDAYEAQILQRLEAAPEEKSQKEEIFKIVDLGGKKEFRYLKVIRLAPHCTQCHGLKNQIAPEVMSKLKEYYPHDQATGYHPGDIRGAFSVRIPLD
jgi:hypothetical protein